MNSQSVLIFYDVSSVEPFADLWSLFKCFCKIIFALLLILFWYCFSIDSVDISFSVVLSAGISFTRHYLSFFCYSIKNKLEARRNT